MLYEKQLQPFLEDFGSEPLCHILRRDHIKKTIFTKIVVVTGSRCLLCNGVCFNGSDFQMCSVGSGCLLGPLWIRGAASSPCCARGAAASLADGIAPASRALLFLVLSGTALVILGTHLRFHVSFWDKSKKGH